MLIAEEDRSGREMHAMYGKRFFAPGSQLRQQLSPAGEAAFSKWMRSISYLPISQLR
jgi:hypothetical protein